ncbi:heterocycloanthracin/sonorensin family bacteriocin [Neobacillus ginsengisoli]|uniref:heterocycloanthracin/sonorensin family bacteriocin n=1 Tax=Neobacillus ginsengisoli TaxID=904295 RepID=UPI003521681B
MQSFQNDLQMLGMDPYNVGEVIPMDPQSQLYSQDARRCGGFRCGGFGCGGFRCGGFRCGGFGCGGFRCGGFRCGGFSCFSCFSCFGCAGCFGGIGFGSCFGLGIGFI